MTPLEWILAVLVAFRLTRLVSEDFPPVKAGRDWLLRRWPGEDTEFPASEVRIVTSETGDDYVHADTEIRLLEVDGRWFADRPHWVGQLIECYWCHGFWISAAVLPVFGPSLRDWVVGAFAVSGAVGLLRSWEGS